MKYLLVLICGLMLLTGCTPAASVTTRQPEVKTSLSGKVSTIQPTLSLEDTSVEEFRVTDFDSVHSPVKEDTNEFLIFGGLPVMDKAAVNATDLANFLGRWEGYSSSPPVKKDRKYVLLISEISETGGTMYGWTGTNLQFPDSVTKVHFRVVRRDHSMIEVRMTWLDGSTLIHTFYFDSEKNSLHGETRQERGNTLVDVFDLTRNLSFYVYKDYTQYLAGKKITNHEYRSPDLKRFGKGYMIYLPEGYEADKSKTWPLIYFLHGSGDRGENLFVLAKASPFMFIREKGPLQAIIVAPLLANKPDITLFPLEYMDGTLKEFLTEYRVDSNRIYLTGLSLGGEAVYRFALHRPEVFAAISPLCAFTMTSNVGEMQKIKDVPVWAIHGADDTVVVPSRGEKPVNELKQAGGNVKFSLLPGHDHDVWTDTYSDPAFYEWLLAQKKK